jgi:SHOCT-like protein
MNEQRKDVLQLLADGKVTPEEAERLIAALERDQQDTIGPGTDARPKAKPRYLRVEVLESSDDSKDGPTRVNIRVPLQLLRAGVRLASLVPPQALGRANDELRRSGVPFDLTQLKPEQLEALVEHLDDISIEVEEPDTTVHIFCE